MSGAPVIDEVVVEFLVESNENLDRLDQDLLAFEQDPGSKTTLASIFRTIHTIKGTCGFLGFSRLEAVTHSGENLLSKLRDGEIQPRAEMFTVLLSLVDAVRAILTAIETTGNEPEIDNAALVGHLDRLANGGAEAVVATAPAPATSRAPASLRSPGAQSPASATPTAATPTTATPSPASAKPAVAPTPQAPPVSQSRPPEPAPAEASVAAPKSQLPQLVLPIAAETPPSPDTVGEARASITDQFVRVDVGVLDRLMDLVGELVLARNQTLQFASTIDDTAFLASTQRLNLITTELQEGIMKTRMQPIGNIVGKFPRIVRDLSNSLGKQVRLEMDGTETELDRTIIEAIKDPLTHLIRNAVDHGIERPEVRRKDGKNPEGVVSLRAFHEGGQVNIEIADDGRGIHPEKLKERAIQRGLVSRDDASRMTERELLNLIFLPGFSTAEKVTNVSGRGVGMDVVKTNIEKIGGTIDLQSRPGRGMQLRIKIPLTLAIIPALIVATGGERYAIPQVNLLELVRLDGEQARGSLETVLGARVYRLRGSLLPIVRLGAALADAESPVLAESEETAINIVVVQADGRQFGLVVDDISDTQEIVVKPLGKALKGVSMFAGATILGDGTVALILDVIGLAQHANVLSAVRERQLQEANAAAKGAAEDSRSALLLFGVHEEGRMAMPLSMVARLEEFPRSIVERAGGMEVVQYRGEIMPLLSVAAAVPERRQAARGSSELHGERETVSVVVFSEQGRSVGLVVDRILDVVEEDLSIQRASGRAGVLGSAVIQGRVTELLDVRGIVRSFDPSFSEEPLRGTL